MIVLASTTDTYATYATGSLTKRTRNYQWFKVMVALQRVVVAKWARHNNWLPLCLVGLLRWSVVVEAGLSWPVFVLKSIRIGENRLKFSCIGILGWRRWSVLVMEDRTISKAVRCVAVGVVEERVCVVGVVGMESMWRKIRILVPKWATTRKLALNVFVAAILEGSGFLQLKGRAIHEPKSWWWCKIVGGKSVVEIKPYRLD